MRVGSFSESDFRNNLDAAATKKGQARGALLLALKEQEGASSLATQEAASAGHVTGIEKQAQMHLDLQKGQQAFDQPLSTENVAGAKIKNDILAATGARAAEAQTKGLETSADRGGLMLGLENKYGESKIKNELAASSASTENLVAEGVLNAKTRGLAETAENVAEDKKANALAMQSSQDYTTKIATLKNDAAANPLSMSGSEQTAYADRVLGRDTSNDPLPSDNPFQLMGKSLSRLGHKLPIPASPVRFKRAYAAKKKAQEDYNSTVATP